MALSGSFNTSGYYGDGAPYYLTFSWSATQDIATNTSTVTWTVKAYGGNSSGYYNTLFQRYTKVANTTKQTNMDSPGTQTVYNGTVVYNGQEVITHNQDGTGSFTATVKASFEYWNTSFNSTGSQTFTLNTIPRAATITSAPNFTDSDNPTIQYSNPAGTVATLKAAISLNGTTASVPYRSVSNTGTSYTFTLTDAERNTLRNGTGTSQKITVYFLLQTTIGTSVFVKNLAKTFTINNNANNKPTVSNTVSSIDNTAIPIRDPDGRSNDHRSEFNNIIVQKYSKLAITVSASGKYNATISSISTSFDNNSYSGSSFTSSIVANSGSLAIASSVTDSRGFSNSYSRSITSYAYTDPTLTGVNVFRCNSGGTAADSGTYLKIEATKGFASVNSKNKAILRYRWRKGTGSWSSWITLLDYGSSSNSYSKVVSPTSFDVTSTYDIQLSVLDYLNKEVRANVSIPTEIVTFHWKKDGNALGFGTYAGDDNSITFGWKPKFTSGSISEFSSNPPYLLGIESFTNGGEMKWKAISDIIATKATKDANGLNIATGYIKRATVVFGESSGSGNTQGWWKVASGSFTTYGNTNLAWLVKDNYAKGTWGILVLEMRGSTGGAVSSWGLRWLFRSNFSVGDFRVVASGTSWTLYGYRNGNYGKTSMIQLQQKDINGADLEQNSAGGVTYYNNTFYGTTAPRGDAAFDYGIVNQANKLGSATVGAADQPIYLNAGTPTSASTVTAATSGIVTRSSGWTINSQSIHKWGRVITVSITLNASSSVSSGNNAFTGTLASAYRPPVNVSASSYYASAVMTAILRTDGAITVRVGGSGSAGASGDTEAFTWTYVI